MTREKNWMERERKKLDEEQERERERERNWRGRKGKVDMKRLVGMMNESESTSVGHPLDLNTQSVIRREREKVIREEREKVIKEERERK